MSKVIELKNKIRRKFRNISRFAVISELPYHYIHNGFKKGDAAHLQRIEEAIERTEDRPVTDEVTPELIETVKNALPRGPKKIAEWCRQNGVNQWWLKEFLTGKVRFKNQFRVKRLLTLLGIE